MPASPSHLPFRAKVMRSLPAIMKCAQLRRKTTLL